MVSMLPGSRLGRYEIIEQIGRGGMATVFKARDPSLDREVAVKVLATLHEDDLNFLERFRQEAQAIARLNHPNILQVYDFGDDKGFTYIVTEYLPAGTLSQKIDRPLSLEDATEILEPLAQALDYAHSQNIVHRDIKPSNVLLDSQQRPVLADFGLSKVMERMSQITALESALGTPEYMAPEQALGRDADYRSDLYSFGILTYRLLVGRAPFRADTPSATLMAHVHQPLPLSDVPESTVTGAVRVLLLKAMAKNPDDRFSSASEMVQALVDAVESHSEAGSDQPTVAGITLVSDALPAPEPPIDSRIIVGTPQDEPRPRSSRFTPVVLAGLVTIATGIVAIVVIAILTGGDDEAQRQSEPTPSSIPASASPVESPPDVSLAEALAMLEETVDEIQAGVVSLRGLEQQDALETKLRTREQLATLADGLFRRNYLRDQVFEAEELYKALDMLDEDDDLEEITLGIVLQQVSALFDDESESLYVLSDAPAIGPLEKLAYASVFMGGLQQQIFDVARIRREIRESGSMDQYRAVNSFMTGEVAQIQRGFVDVFLSDEEVTELNKPLADNLLTKAPDVVRKTILMPQREGSDFVAAIFAQSGSWDGVNDVYLNPPSSTEQILHPEKYLSGEIPLVPELPDLKQALGRGWNLISANTMGEFLLRTYLEENLNAAQASDAAAGWGGDRFALLSGPEAERVFAMLVNWDTANDASEFFGSYQQFAEAKTAGQSVRRFEDVNGRTWVTPEQATSLQISGSSTLIIIADTEDLIESVSNAFGGL